MSEQNSSDVFLDCIEQDEFLDCIDFGEDPQSTKEDVVEQEGPYRYQLPKQWTFEEKFEFLLRTKDKTEAWAHAACGSVANIQIQLKSHNDLIPDEFLGMKRIKFTENDTGERRRKYKLKGSSSSGTIEVSVFWCH